MALAFDALPLPLHLDADGVVRVGSTRVTLDTVVMAFEEGAIPEEIVFQYPSLRLPDVYAVISYYLSHRQEVEDYVSRGEQQAEAVRHEIAQRSDAQGIRERLLARKIAGQA